jgi:3-oxosteroid 1-dehydrogenase
MGDAVNMGENRSWDSEADIVVVGSGAAALAAALTASVGGARVVILEKSLVLGGTTAMSGAGTWIPANHHMLAAGMTDSKDQALTYLRATAPAGWQAEEDALWQSFVEHAPAMLAFVEANTPLQFELVHHPDLYVEAPGGKFRGRMVSPLPISRNILGRWRNRIRSSTLPQIFTYREMVIGTVLSQPVRTLSRMAPSLFYRLLTRRVGMGNALVTGLLKGCLDRGCEIMAGTAAERLITEGDERGRVVGVAARASDRTIVIRARKGVVLATGGFEWNDERRGKYFPGETGLIGSPRTNTGDGHRMAEAVGARLARMDQANIYAVTNTVYEGKRHAKPLNEAYKPHGILVNRHGRRFVNEGDPNVGVVLDARDSASGAPIHLPCWRIFDARYAAQNNVAMWLGRRDPHWFRKAGSVAELARLIDLDPAVLAATVERFNGFARAGRDEDFRRGETQWEMFHTADPTRPNRNGALATIEKPPFYAAPYHRAILTTKGGPRTNERGQVLRHDGSVIGGLYCAGVAMANPIGTKAVGAGTTIGPCLTWGYICGKSLLRENA